MSAQQNPVNTTISDALRDLIAKKEAFENTTVRIGIIGESGSGKSSIINAIAGKYISDVGPVETTDEPLPCELNGITYVDLPGCSTKKWPVETYIQKLGLDKNYDAFIFVNRGRILENEITIYRELRAKNFPIFIARNLFDNAVNGERAKPADQQRSEDELKQQIVEDFRKQLNAPLARVFVTAAAPGADRYELPALQEAIMDALGDINGHKRQRFLMGTKAYTKDLLDRKRASSKTYVHAAAASAAAAAIVPIPGVGIAADLTIIASMNMQIAKTFGIDVDSTDPRVTPVLGSMLTSLGKLLTKEGIIVALKPLAARVTAQEAAKWIPFIGTAIAMGIAASTVELLGNQAIDEFYKAAETLLKAGL